MSILPRPFLLVLTLAGAMSLLPGCAEPEITSRNVARWQRQADAGDRSAHYYLGAAYAEGRQVEKDTEAAFDYWRVAAERGDRRAQHNLGVMYWSGDWVRRDLVHAYMWFNLAAGQGLSPSARMRDELEPFMTRAEIALAQQMTEQTSRRLHRDEHKPARIVVETESIETVSGK